MVIFVIGIIFCCQLHLRRGGASISFPVEFPLYAEQLTVGINPVFPEKREKIFN